MNNEGQNEIRLPAFRLYGLIGCPACQSALEYLQKKSMNADVVVANNDALIAAGAQALYGAQAFPILISRITNETIQGFKPEEYDRLAIIAATLIGSGPGGISSNSQQSNGESSSETSKAN